MNDTVSEVLKNVATTAGILGVLWVVLKDKIAADLVPKLELYFTTKKNSSDYRDEHQKDHRLMESQISTVAEHKASQAIGPVSARVDVIEKEFKQMNDRIDATRKENREDFGKVFDQLAEMNESIIRLTATKEK